ncbi:MAG: ribonuclease J [Nanoarchaeota archaeon]|nr:ribonuclease J [Nanoarchaeota archaeon]
MERKKSAMRRPAKRKNVGVYRGAREPKSEEKRDENALRFAALGGLEEIGRNMMFLEYKDEIIIIDLGLQFPEEETPGIDYIIPDISYLEKKKESIKGIVITHAHLDHIGAAPYLMERLGNPLIYTTELTKEIMKRRHDEFLHAPRLNFKIVKSGEILTIGEYFSAEFFDVQHNIPDTVGLVIGTPVGNILHPGEYKLDRTKNGKSKTLDTFKEIGKKNILAMLQDSTGATKPGYSIPEETVVENIETIFKEAPGRIVVGTFASLLDRLYEIIKVAEKMGKVVATSGFSMKTNVQIAQNLGYMKIGKGVMINLEDIEKYDDKKIVILCTGAQGEPDASLMRIGNGEHRHVRTKPGDTFIFSSSVIPGNERSVQTLKDNLSRQGAIIHTSETMDIHSSGHAPQEEIKEVVKIINPKFFIPIHGYYFMRATNIGLAIQSGVKKENAILVDNGDIIEFTKTEAKITGERVPASSVFVDGLGVGDIGEVVLRDRRTLAEEGMIVVIASINRKTGKVIKNPDIISRGFIYLKENKELLDEIRRRVRMIIGRVPHYQDVDVDYIKSLIKDQVAEFLYNKTNRRPMVLPVIIEI